jgi:hypothetical protein
MFRYYERIRLPQEPSLGDVQPGHPGQKYYVSWKTGNTGWIGLKKCHGNPTFLIQERPVNEELEVVDNLRATDHPRLVNLIGAFKTNQSTWFIGFMDLQSTSDESALKARLNLMMWRLPPSANTSFKACNIFIVFSTSHMGISAHEISFYTKMDRSGSVRAILQGRMLRSYAFLANIGAMLPEKL